MYMKCYNIIKGTTTMLIKINKIEFKTKNPIEISISNLVKNKIKECWNSFIKNKKNYWDGDIFCVTDIDLKKGIIEIGKTKYSSLVYGKIVKDLTIISLFASILLMTKDNKYVIIKNNHNCINLIGGMADKMDFINNQFSPDLCIKREVLEEIGIDLTNPKQVLNYHIKYLKIPENGEKYYPIGILYIGNLNFTSNEFKEYMNNKKHDNEILEIYYYNKEECLNLELKDSDISYLKEFVLLESNG